MLGQRLVECRASLFCVPDWRPCVDFQPVIWTHCATQKPHLMSGQALSRSCRDHTRDGGTVLGQRACTLAQHCAGGRVPSWLFVYGRMVTGCRPARTLSVHLMMTSSPMHLLSAALPFQFQVNMERSVVIVDRDSCHDPCRVIHVAWFHHGF